MRKKFVLFFVGALGYGGLEILYRGNTHWTMLLAGGTALCVLDGIARLRMPLWAQALLGCGVITLLEGGIGVVCNLWLGWHIWDYSRFWGNWQGQICPVFSALWYLLSLALLWGLRRCAAWLPTFPAQKPIK